MIAVMPSVVFDDVLKPPRVNTRNSAFPRRVCWPTLVRSSLIRANSRWTWLTLFRINSRVASGDERRFILQIHHVRRKMGNHRFRVGR